MSKDKAMKALAKRIETENKCVKVTKKTRNKKKKSQ